MADVAQAVGGRLLGDTDRLKNADSIQRKLAEKLAGDVGLHEAVATMNDSVRYSIGLPDAAYTAGVETAMRHLVEQGFRPADFRSRWDGTGSGGLFTTWSDPHTGQLFEVQFHTDASYHATHTTAPSLAGLRLLAGPGDATIARHPPISIPDGASAIRLPEDAPAVDPLLDPLAAAAEPPDGDIPSRDEVDDWELADDEALELVYDSLLVTDAGLAFYAVDDDIREFATAVHPTDGFVTIDLHGAPDSFEIDGFLLSPHQFAGALRHLRDQGLLELPPGVGIKLMSCDTAVGGPDSAAATLARELGVVVVAPDQPVWTTRNGEEIVSSAALVDGRWTPTDPPDGDWHAFDAVGNEIPLDAGYLADNPSSRAGDAADRRGDDAADGHWDDAAVRGSEGTASGGMRASWADSEWPIGPDPRPSAADQLRVDRDNAHADLVHRSTSVAEVVRSADSLGELFDRGVRPDEIAHNLDGATLARLTPDLAPAERAELRVLLNDPRMLDALRRSWDESAGGGNQILAETLLRQLLGGSALVRVMNSNDVLMHSLTSRPSTMSNLMRHPRAVTALAQVVAEVRHHGVATILAAPRGGPGSTPLATWQRRIVDQLRLPKQELRQPGFDHLRRQDSAYVERYVRDLYGHARVAQVELDSIATSVAERSAGSPHSRSEPKGWRRVMDKIARWKGDAARLHDLAGAMIQYGTLADLYRGLEHLVRTAGPAIVSLEDRFARPQPSGYRDVQLRLRMSNGHIAELRLHLRGVDDVATWEHALFEVTRDFEALASLEPASRAVASERAAISRLIRSVQQDEFLRAVVPAVS